METNQEDQRIKDIKQAWVGAHAEKPVRDLAREEGITEEEKAILDRLAERRGEGVMREYAAEKEKNPAEQLLARVDKIAVEMRKKGLEQDAIIVEKIAVRFNRYAETLRKNKADLEKQWNRRLSLRDLQQIPGQRLSNSIPVTFQIGEGGGRSYWPSGSQGGWFGEKGDLEKYKYQFEEYREQGAEVINFSFSEKGETEFYRALGILTEDEETIDIPTIYQEAVGKGRIEPSNFKVRFPTGIEGVRLYIQKESEGSRSPFDGKKNEEISLEFDDGFLQTILAKK